MSTDPSSNQEYPLMMDPLIELELLSSAPALALFAMLVALLLALPPLALPPLALPLEPLPPPTRPLPTALKLDLAPVSVLALGPELLEAELIARSAEAGTK